MTFPLRHVVLSVGVLVLGLVISGCSAGSSQASAEGAVGTSGTTGPAFLDLENTGHSLVLKNRAGQPLMHLSLSITSGSNVYTLNVDRLESTERREIELSQFKSRMGVPLSSGKLKEVDAVATDFVGAKRQMTMAMAR